MTTSSTIETRAEVSSGYVVATPVPPSITCPDWCRISQVDHVEQLRDHDGFVIHYSTARTGSGWSVSHSRGAFPDGTPDPAELPEVHADSTCNSLEATEAYAQALLATVAEARR